MRIAIIDDEDEIRVLMKEYINRFQEESGITMDVTVFESGVALLDNYTKTFDILIFDVDMPGISGIETAKKIREQDQNVTIIFITNMAQYAINGYEVDAVDYIIKPISYYDFSMKFHRTVAKAAQRGDRVIMIDTVEGYRRLKVSNITFIEIISHYLYFHTEKSVYKVRGSMKEWEGELKSYSFVRTHKSYLVNMKFIEEVKTRDIVVSGEVIPLGRGYKEQLFQEYMKYIRGGM